MTFCAPMIGKVAGAIFNQAKPNTIKLLSAPVSCSGFPLMFSGNDLSPGGCAKGYIFHFHIDLRNGCRFTQSILIHHQRLQQIPAEIRIVQIELIP